MGQTVADLRVEEAGVPRALRAGDFTDATVAAIEDAALLVAAVRDRLPAALDGGRLAVRADGTVALDSATLAALEQIVVTGTVALDAPTLAALESITAVGPLTDTQLRAGPVVVETGPDTVARGTATGTVSLPAGAHLHSVLVIPSTGGQVTVTIPGQSADQCPIDFPYAEDFGGKIVGAGSIVLAGSVAYYRITWDA